LLPSRIQIWLVTGQHMATRHAAQPSQLPFGQLPAGSYAGFAQAVQVSGSGMSALQSFQHVPALAIAHTPHGRQLRMQVTAVSQSLHFMYQALLQHGIKALCNALV
jgi:hypothetical protein